ncbi:creatininase family protein, partial [Klebsiella pneumoniae]
MANIVAVLPICAVEQHGAHLPVRVFAEWFTDLVYDGVFEVLQWLLFLSAVPPVQ